MAADVVAALVRKAFRDEIENADTSVL